MAGRPCLELRAIKDVSKGEEITIFHCQDVTSQLFQTEAVLEAGGAGAGADATWGPVTYWFLSTGWAKVPQPIEALAVTSSTRQTR